ncbi:response regulator [Arcobacter sp. LA11]|uniref:response regulator n=1 Tax=Arcobacter sp. LA11 TaxID=1898176 RepID=UPI000934D677|nr:response regulator [Arcobacter sp. LA11]
MINNNFLKKLIILYVEDDETTREQLSKLLKRLFKTVVIATNGEEGYIKFKEITSRGYVIDLVLSDINMPKLNGIDMLEKIRELDDEVPFIFTTARSESEYLMKAIELNVDHYALKPVDMEDILLRIQKVCEKKYYEKIVKKQRFELENYFNAISQVATIYKMNEEGKIIYANKNFLTLSRYTKDEVKELVVEDLLHKDIPDEFIEKTWNFIRAGKIWRGDTKYIDRNKEAFYLKITIFKIEGDENEYVTIGFNQTEEYLKKRDFHKNVMLNMKDKNMKITELNRASQNQSYQIDQLSDYSMELQKKVEEEKAKGKANLRQINYYEKKLTNIDEKYESILKKAEARHEDFMAIYNTMKNKYDSNAKKASQLEEELELNRKLVENRNEKIKNLETDLRKRESQLRKIDPKLIYQ